MSPDGRIWVMTLLTLGEPRSLKIGEANPEDGVATGLVLGLEISRSSTNSLVGEMLPVTSETKIGSEIYSVAGT